MFNREVAAAEEDEVVEMVEDQEIIKSTLDAALRKFQNPTRSSRDIIMNF